MTFPRRPKNCKLLTAYDIFGLKPGATNPEIKRAYHAFCERQENPPHRSFEILYELLTERRAQYNQTIIAYFRGQLTDIPQKGPFLVLPDTEGVKMMPFHLRDDHILRHGFHRESYDQIIRPFLEALEKTSVEPKILGSIITQTRYQIIRNGSLPENSRGGLTEIAEKAGLDNKQIQRAIVLTGSIIEAGARISSDYQLVIPKQNMFHFFRWLNQHPGLLNNPGSTFAKRRDRLPTLTT